ncbi:pentapeptide repeat-containing protein [Amycolatopsis lurida]|uniref:pentapeptide repeat-containing protein n=1 Tax=Amycolatopsis lurida TaxID=31959 RepID=UPI00130126B7|nr:pentapeptide repeat-containing protein [Amycolatopsis lurida]
MWLTLVVSVAAGTTITALLWGDTPTNHRDAFDIGWKSSAAVLAILAAFVTVERLRLSQREHHRQLDNDEATHINTLSSQASEQLGSDKAAVRIGGLTDLERLAEQYPDLRQTVVDRICAYLRAPYQPPPNLAAVTFDAEPESRGAPATQAGPRLSGPSDDEIAARRLELDVRRTAQQILHRHLRNESRPENSLHNFWDGISLDLRDAALIEIDFSNCRMASADFRGAKFYGRAKFLDVSFDGDAEFDGATFTRSAHFNKATFAANASFDNVAFNVATWFTKATFSRNATFDIASFDGIARFNQATFASVAWFENATFVEEVAFIGATFTKGVMFDESTFAKDAIFSNAIFAREAHFQSATFEGRAIFDAVEHDANFEFHHARVTKPGQWHSWPAGWRMEDSSDAAGNVASLVRINSSQDDVPGSRSGDEPEIQV